jgi:hypothetical protein
MLLISTNGVLWTNSLSASGGEGQGEVASVSIQFLRDASGRIQQIVDPQGHILNYAYGTNGSKGVAPYY